MGGSGGGRAYPTSDTEVEALRERVLEDLHDQERIAEINEFLAQKLASFNNRDVDLVRERLEELQDALGELTIDVDRLLFGGSVAKHTFVDGLSDVDALVVIDDPGVRPGQIVERFRSALATSLGAGDVQEVSAGTLAVTVKYRDGSEIQLLPAVERDGRTSIAAENGSGWRQIRPHKFAEKLTNANAANGRAVVPTIKLAKAVFSNLPEAQRLSGYHVEAIGVDAFRSYEGRRDRASMLVHLVRHTQQAVLRPTGDITGQSVHIDQHFGAANSSARKALSSAIGRIAARLERGTADDYRRLFDD